jgi:hypothetical protein
MAMFRQPCEFTVIEKAVLDRVAELLQEPARSRFLQWIRLVNSIQRLWEDKEVDLYVKSWFRTVLAPADLKFSYPKEEYKLARIRLTSRESRFKTTADVWVANGQVFSIEFAQTPRKLGSDFEITDAQLLQDPMSSEVSSECSIESKLPADYLKLLRADRRNINGWKILDVSDIRSVATHEARFHILAEKDSVGAVGVKDEDQSGNLYYFDFNSDEQRMVGDSLEGFCQSL